MWRGDCPLFVERGDFDGGAAVHAARWGLGGAPIMGTLVAAPGLPAGHEVVTAVRELGAALPVGDLGAITRLDWGGTDSAGGADRSLLCCRYLGASAERGARYLREAWRTAAPAAAGTTSRRPAHLGHLIHRRFHRRQRK